MAGRVMWNLTPDNIQLIKEELKGRRAAIEARYADELTAIASDLDEIETLERLAYAFAVKHLPEVKPADVSDEPAVELAPLQLARAEPPTTEEPSPETHPEAKGGSSRWRLRADLVDA
jgi:hypothetical protein